VDLLDQADENADAIPSTKKLVRDGATDEPCATGD
jgi:hypothetical protein